MVSNRFFWAFQTQHLLFLSIDQFNFAGTASLLWQFCFEPSSSTYLSLTHPDNIWTLWNKTLCRHGVSSVTVLFWAFAPTRKLSSVDLTMAVFRWFCQILVSPFREGKSKLFNFLWITGLYFIQVWTVLTKIWCRCVHNWRNFCPLHII